MSGATRLGGIFAQLPTWSEQGINGASFVAWRGMIAPPDINAPQVAYWENGTKSGWRGLKERNHDCE